MSYYRLPDPHPGRCENFRTIMHGDGHVETLRCLDYEGTKHICEFPNPMHVVSRDHGWAGSLSSEKQNRPQPWVKPQPRYVGPSANDAVPPQNDSVFMGGNWR